MIILQKEILRDLVNQTRNMNRTIAFTNGCFDILHEGHIQLLEYSKMCGDILIVGMNSDESVRKIKGPRRPIIPDRSRARVMEAIRFVDHVFVFEEETPLEIIKIIKPEVLIKGGDWIMGKIVGYEYAGKVNNFPFVGRHSTTKIVDSIIHGYI